MTGFFQGNDGGYSSRMVLPIQAGAINRECAAVSDRTRALDRLAKFFMVAWISILLQGALRKWIFPGLTIMYLVQDLPLLAAYVYAIYKGIVWNRLALACIALAIWLSIQSLAQVILVGHSITVAVIGLHHFIFYLPILFLLPPCMNRENRKRFVRFNLLSIVPMSIIAALQALSPRGTWINRTSAGDDTAFLVGNGAVRATGTFNFTMSFSIWCGIVVALVIGEWLRPSQDRALSSKWILVITSCAAAIATFDSASRTAVIMAAAACTGGVAVALVTRNYKNLASLGAMLAIIPVLTFAAYFVAPLAFSGLIDRFSGESYQREMTNRISDMTIGFLYTPSSSFIGQGIGSGIQAAHVGSAAAYQIDLLEMENLRIVQEMGVIPGGVFVILRYIAGFALIVAGFKALRAPQVRFASAVPLAFTLAPTITVGELIRSAPVIATQEFFFAALICGAVLFSREPLQASAVVDDMR